MNDRSVRCGLYAVMTFLVALPAVLRAVPPDYTATGVIGSIDRTFTYNLGPTGMRGLIFNGGDGNGSSSGNEGTISALSRQILVTVVGPNTPAAGVLAVDDVILGACAGSGTVPMFSSDARKSFGWALGEAEKESNNGVLGLKRWRAGVTTDVTITLPVMGSYTDSAPYNCAKSALVLAHARDYLVNQMLADPSFLSLDYAGAIKGLGLLGGVLPGDANYAVVQSRLQTFARALAPTSLRLSGCDTWGWGYIGVFLSEYYLNSVDHGTPDANVLHGLNEYTVALAKAQSLFGTYGHGGANLTADGSLHGSIPWYGPVNQCGIIANLAIVMGKKAVLAAGMALDPEIDPAIERGSNFFAYYVNKGCIPYGEHEPYLNGHASNGKDASCAVLFGVQDNRNVEAEYYARLTTAEYNGREYGHTGQGFSYLWGALGANMGGPAAVAAYLQQVRWHLDLERRSDGSFVYDGGEQYGAGSTADGTYLGASSYSGVSPTASYVLTYSLPLRRLYITGKNANPAHTLDATRIANAIAAGCFKQTCTGYTTGQLLTALNEYDPVVREYTATELATRTLTTAEVNSLMVIAEGPEANARMGACQTLGLLKTTAALPALGRRLSDPDIWVRAMAARALNNFGAGASPQLATMLTAMAANGKPAVPIDWSDPLQFPNGYLAQAAFTGDLAVATSNADKSLLYPAVRTGLQLPSGMMRWALGGPGDSFITDKLSLTDVEALIPEIFQVVNVSAPGDLMYAPLARYGGIRTLAKWNIVEGMDLALANAADLGSQSTAALETYGEAARWTLPDLYDSMIDAATTAPTLIYGLPYAAPQVVATTTPKAIALSGSDCRHAALSYTILTQPAHGTLAGTPPALTYTPTSGYRGVDSFTFKVGTVLADSAPATVNIIVGDAGTGLKGEYFNNMDFTALTARRTDAIVNFDWETAAPVSTMGADTYSVRWTGQLLAPETGNYRFSTRTGDGTRLWLNGVELIADWNDHVTQWNTAPAAGYNIALIAGQKYDLKMEYYKNSSPATTGLYWTTPSCKYNRIIQQEWLYPTSGVSLAAPANGARYPAGGPIPLNADVTNAGGAIASVAFYNGDTLLGSASAPPYSFIWANVPVGTYNVTVRVTNNLGVVSTSAVTVVTVSNDVVPVSTGLACWFDASRGVITNAMGILTKWEDLSGNAHHASFGHGLPFLALNQLNSRPTAGFRDTFDWLNLAGNLFVKEQYVVVRSPYPTWSSGGAFLGRTTGRASSYQLAPGKTTLWNDQLPLAVTKNGAVIPAAQVSYYGFDLAPITNFMLLKIVVNDNDTSAAAYQIGRADGGGCAFDVAEIIGYSTTLSAADELRVGNYLSAKYGITTTYAAAPGHPAPLTWNATASGSGPSDGSGIWSTASGTWWNGSTNRSWTDANDALIGSGGTGGTITPGTVVTNNLTFGNFTGTYTLAGGSLTVKSNISSNASGNLSISTPITGTGGLTQAGPGTLTLTGSHTYTGATVVNGGTLELALSGTNSLASLLTNASFETHGVLGAGSGTWAYNPIGAEPWVFSNGNAGIAAKNTPWVASGAAINGAYAGFIQRAGSLSQTFTVPAAGLYNLSFLAANRPNKPASALALKVDAVTVGSWPAATFTNGTFNNYSVTNMQLTAGTHTVTFQGTDSGVDSATAIDIIPVASAVPNMLPTNATVCINSGGVLALKYSGSLRVGSLSINGTLQPAGSYGAANLPAYITGTGLLNVQNTAPVISDTKPAAVTLSENGNPSPFSLTLHASDADGDTLTWSVSTPAAHGTASASGTGTSKAIGYTSAANYYGSDSFVVTVADGHGGGDTITVNVTVQHVNQPPVITETGPAEVVMSENGSPMPFSLTLYAADPDGDTLTWAVSTTAGHGTASASGTGTSMAIAYTPLTNYYGMDSFAVQVADSNGGSDTITVNVTINYVNQPPVVSLTAPLDGAVFVAPPVLTLAATAADSDGTVVRVDFYNDSALIGSATTAPYTFTWTNVPLGACNLTARATDDGGLVGTSVVAHITVNGPSALTWDANGTGSGQTDGNGTWINSSSTWWNGAANVNWVDGNDAVIGSGGVGGTLTLGAVVAHNLTFGGHTGTYTLTGGSLTVYNQLAANSSGNITLNTPLAGTASLTKTNTGTLTLPGANSYSGATIISGGTLALGAAGTLAAGSSISIAAGATMDVSGLGASATFTLGSAATLTASGSGTVVGTSAAAIKGGASGTVSLGSRPITLNYDGSHPALYVSQGKLSLSGNAFTVNRATPLANGTYTLIQQTTGSVVSGGALTVAGTAIDAALHTAYLVVSGGNVTLVVTDPTPTKLVITAVNGGTNPTASAAYGVTVTVQDVGGITRNVAGNTGVTLSLTSGTAGSLGGTLTGTIPIGSSTVTVNGVSNRVAEQVTLRAATSSGTSLTAGSASYAIVPAAAASLTVAGFPGTPYAGAAGSVTVTAKDAYGNRATNYTGTIHFTSNDATAALPGDYAFSSGDAGTHTFTNGVTFNSGGTRVITATDTATATITGTQTGIMVSNTHILSWATPGATTWTAPAGVTAVRLLAVGGGGGGGGNGACGGGGAGGLVYYGPETPGLAGSYAVTSGQTYSVTVGAGGAVHANGQNSSFGAVTAAGGGYGGQRWNEAGGVGGSGGGASILAWGTIASGAAGTGGQGHAGGGSLVSNGQQYAVGGGGGGAGTAGSSARLIGVVGAGGTLGYAGNGGDGLSYAISGTAVTYAGGGGGSQIEAGVNGTGGAGYLNPGGGGNAGTASPGQNGLVMVSYTVAPFASWIGGFAGVPANQTGFADDSNNDGVANGLAWILLGGTPTGDSRASLPVATQSAGKVIVEFTCLRPDQLGNATLELQYGNDLGTWQAAAVPGSNITVNRVVFTVTGYDATHNHVKAEIPQSAAAGGKLFSRLHATLP